MSQNSPYVYAVVCADQDRGTCRRKRRLHNKGIRAIECHEHVMDPGKTQTILPKLTGAQQMSDSIGTSFEDL